MKLSKKIAGVICLAAMPVVGCAAPSEELESTQESRSDALTSTSSATTAAPAPSGAPSAANLVWSDGCSRTPEAGGDRVFYRAAYEGKRTRSYFELRVSGKLGLEDTAMLGIYDRSGKLLASGEVSGTRTSARWTEAGRRLSTAQIEDLRALTSSMVVDADFDGCTTAKKWPPALRRFLRALCMVAATACGVLTGGLGTAPCAEAGEACKDAVDAHP